MHGGVLWLALLIGLAWGQSSSTTTLSTTVASTTTSTTTSSSTTTPTTAPTTASTTTTTTTTTTSTTTTTTTTPTTVTTTTTTSTTTPTTTTSTSTTTSTTTTTIATTTSTTTPTSTTTTTTTSTTTPTSTTAMNTTTTRITTTISPASQGPRRLAMMFYLDFDRIFMGDPAKYLPAFQDSIISMLSTQFDPPIFVSRNNITISAGTVGNFSDRTTIANISFATPAIAARVQDKLNQIGLLNIFYISFTFYPVPLNYDASIQPRPQSEISRELAVNVTLITLSFVGLLAAYLKFHRPYIHEPEDAPRDGDDSPVPLTAETKVIVEDSGFSNPSYVPSSVQRAPTSRSAYTQPLPEDDEIPDVNVADDFEDDFADARTGDLGLDGPLDDDDYQVDDDAHLVGLVNRR